jgi:signal peptidase I
VTTDHQTAPTPVQARTSHFWRDTAVIVIIALVLSSLVRTFLFQAFYVPSGSMLPTLQLNDRIVVSKLTGSHVERGDLVVFRDPGGWLTPTVEPTGLAGGLRSFLTLVGLLPSDSGDDLVKRVVGMPGDRVVCCNAQQQITINGVALNEPYLAPGGTAQVQFDITVPADRIFVMGDHRGDSEDSRFHLQVANGTVPLANVVGPVIAVVWPLERFQRFSVPDTFANPKLNAQSSTAPVPSPSVSGEAHPGPVGPG